jgi:hypothetical protein
MDTGHVILFADKINGYFNYSYLMDTNSGVILSEPVGLILFALADIHIH